MLIATAEHELTLYADPGPFFEAVERAIAAASRRVWLETYSYRNDELGVPFSELLVPSRRGRQISWDSEAELGGFSPDALAHRVARIEQQLFSDGH